MIKNLVVQTVLCKRIVNIVISVCIPVICQLLWAKHENTFVSGLVILDYCQSSEGLTETNRVSQNTAVVFFKFIDNGEDCITLEVKHHTPNLAVLEACCLIRKCILRYIIKELAEDIVKRNEVNELR